MKRPLESSSHYNDSISQIWTSFVICILPQRASSFTSAVSSRVRSMSLMNKFMGGENTKMTEDSSSFKWPDSKLVASLYCYQVTKQMKPRRSNKVILCYSSIEDEYEQVFCVTPLMMNTNLKKSSFNSIIPTTTNDTHRNSVVCFLDFNVWRTSLTSDVVNDIPCGICGCCWIILFSWCCHRSASLITFFVSFQRCCCANAWFGCRRWCQSSIAWL